MRRVCANEVIYGLHHRSVSMGVQEHELWIVKHKGLSVISHRFMLGSFCNTFLLHGPFVS